jgi:hypothetical protein
VEKNGERLPYNLATKRNGVIEKQLLRLRRQIAPQFARGPSQSNKELFLRLLFIGSFSIHRFSVPYAVERTLFAAPLGAAKSELRSVLTMRAYLAGGSCVCVDPGTLSGLPPGI